MKYKLIPSKKTIFFFVLSTLVLFLSFFSNFWRIVDRNWFKTIVTNGNGRVLARLVKSRQDGVFSAAGLLGDGYINGKKSIDRITYVFQYEAYMNSYSFDKYVPYESQIGGQGIFFSILQKVIHRSPYKDWRLFTAITAMAAALALAAILLWFYWEFGLFTGVFVLVTVVFSGWLVVTGNRPFWQLWAFYLPMIIVMYYLKYRGVPAKRQFIEFGVIIFAAVAVKCVFNGYEYITTTLVMMVVPFVYYCLVEKTNMRKFINASLVVATSSCLAILLSLIILSAQISVIEGSLQKGINYIVFSLEKRTYGNPADFKYNKTLRASQKAKPIDVVITYLNTVYFDPNVYNSTYDPTKAYQYGIRYWHLIIVFAIFSIILFLSRNKFLSKSHNVFALICATWFSILAPLSWFIILKSGAYIHTLLYPVVWQMPFTLFGFAICGLVFQLAFSKFFSLFHSRSGLSQAQIP